MATVRELPAPTWTMSRLRRHFGMIPVERILNNPLPGTATETELLRLNERDKRLCELVDGCLVEKAMGLQSSLLAMVLVAHFQEYLKKNDLGIILGPDGMLRLWPGLVRGPDVSFIAWEQIGEEVPDLGIADYFPDLAVEVMSRSNTKKEMQRKREEYFARGTRLVWQIHPGKRIVEVFSDPDTFVTLSGNQVLDGGEVLPGFALTLKDLFAPLKRRSR